MPDYEIEVDVVPGSDGFRPRLAELLEREERRSPSFDVEIDAEIAKQFRRDADAKVKKALASLDAQVSIDPKLSKQFRKDLRAALDIATGKVGASVAISAKLAPGFRKDLAAEVTKATAARPVPVHVSAKLGAGFARDLRKEAAASTKAKPAEVFVAPKLGAGFRAALNRLTREGTKAKPAEVFVLPKLSGRFRSTAQRLVTELTRAKPVEMPVSPTLSKVGYAKFVKETETDLRAASKAIGASGATDVPVGSDTAKFQGGLVAKVRAATSAISGTDAADIELGIDTGAAVTKLGVVGGLLTGLKTQLLTIGKIGGITALVGGAGLAGGVVVGFGAAVNAAANFEQQLSNVQAVSGVTGEALDQLRQQAIKAGQDTAFSAKESAEAQFELSKAGASVEQILSGGLGASLDLAAAGEIALGDAAAYVATGLNTFGLEGTESARVADTLAAAANRSAADIPDIGQALSQSGLVAKQFGLTIEETTGTLALFAQNGLKGSDAGTAFKTALLRLNPASKEARGAMERIGLSAYDAQGNFIGLEAVAGQLQTGLGKLNKEQRDTTLLQIFGQDAIRAGNLLYEQGAEGIANWTDQVTASGYATDVAGQKLNNLKGDVQILKGSLETVFIEAGSSQQSGLRDVVQSLIPLVNTLGPGLIAAISPIGTLITNITPMLEPLIDALLPAMESFGKLLVPIAGVITSIATVFLQAFTPALDAALPLVEGLGFAIGAFVKPLLPVLGELASGLLTALAPLFDELADEDFVDALVSLATSFAEILVAVAPLIPILVSLTVPLVTLLVKGLALRPVLYGLVGAFVAYKLVVGAAKAVQVGLTLATKAYTIYTKVATAAQWLWNAAMSANPIGLVVAALALLVGGVILAYKHIEPFRDLMDGIGRFFRDTLWPSIKGVASAVGDFFVAAWGKAVDVFNVVWPILERIGAAFGRVAASVLSLFSGPIGAIVDYWKALFSLDFAAAGEAVVALFESLPGVITGFIDKAGTALTSIAGWISSTAVPFIVEKSVALFFALWGWAQTAAGKLVELLGPVATAVGDWITNDAVPFIVEKSVALGTALVGWISTVVPLIAEKSVALVGAFVGWIAEVAPKLATGLFLFVGVIGSWFVTELIPTVVTKAAGLVAAFVGWVVDVAPGVLGALSVFLVTVGAWIVTVAVPWLVLKALELTAAFTGWIAEVAPGALAALGGFLVDIGVWIVGTAIPWVSEQAAGLIVSLVSWVAEAIPSMLEALGGLLVDLGAWIVTDAIPWVAEKALGLVGSILGWILTAAIQLPFKLIEFAAKLFFWIGGFALDIAAKVIPLGVSILGWIVQAVIDLPGKLWEFATGLYTWITETSAELIVKAGGMVISFLTWIGQAIIDLPGKLWEFAQGIWDWILEVGPQVVDKAAEIGTSFLTWITDTVTELPGKLAEIVTAIGTWLGELPQKILDLITGLASKLAEVGTGLVKSLFSGLLDLGEGALDFGKDIVNSIIGFINEKIIGNINSALELDLGPISINPPDIPDIPELAEGGIIRRPTLAIVGEAGPEIVAPLNNRKRLLELLAQAGVLDPVAVGVTPEISGGAVARAASPGLPAGGAALGTVGLQGDTAGLDSFVADSVGTLEGFGSSVTDASMPGLEDWRTAADGVFVDTKSAIDEFSETSANDLGAWANSGIPAGTLPGLSSWSSSVGDLMADTSATLVDKWATGVGQLGPIAALGSASAVAGMAAGLATGTEKIATITTGYSTALANALNPILTAVGSPKLELATGGLVPGPNVDRDIVPALLMPGEVVIRKERVEQVGAKNLVDFNNGRTPKGWRVPRFAEGGLVTGDTEGLNPEFQRRLGLWATSVGTPYNVGSGYRSIVEQQRLYSRWLRRVPGQAQAAPPGRSMHNFGLASDGPHWRGKNPGAFGLRYPMSFEPWHVEPNEARQWSKNGAPDGTSGGSGSLAGLVPFPEVPEMPHSGTAANVARAAMEFARSEALDWAAEQTIGYAGGNPSLAAGDFPTNVQRSLAAIRKIESGGNYSARNPNSSAFGAYQFIESTWRAQAKLAGVDPSDRSKAAQDKVAGAYVSRLLAQHGSDIRAIPAIWYTGSYNPARTNYVPAGGNRLTVAQYIAKWLEAYGDVPGFADGGLVEPSAAYRVAMTRAAAFSSSGSGGGFPSAATSGSSTTVGRQVNIGDGIRVEVVDPGTGDPEGFAMIVGHRVLGAVAKGVSR